MDARSCKPQRCSLISFRCRPSQLFEYYDTEEISELLGRWRYIGSEGRGNLAVTDASFLRGEGITIFLRTHRGYFWTGIHPSTRPSYMRARQGLADHCLRGGYARTELQATFHRPYSSESAA